MNWLKNAKVKTKLTVLMILSILFTAAAGSTGYYYLTAANATTKSMYQDRLLAIVYLTEAQSEYNDNCADRFEFMITTDPARNRQLSDQIKTQTETISANIGKYGATKLDPDEVTNLTKLKETWSNAQQVADEVDALSSQNKNAEAYALYLSKLEPLNGQIAATLDTLVKYNEDVAAKNNEANQAKATKAGFMVLGIVVAALVISVSASLFIIRLISNPLSEMASYIRQVAEGDLSVETLMKAKKSEVYNDEIGALAASVVHMRENLSTLLMKVIDSSEQIAASSEELTANTEQASAGVEDVAKAVMIIANGSNNQIRAVSETSETIQQTSTSIRQVAENAEQTAADADRTMEATRNGETAIRKSREQMTNIENTVLGLDQIIRALGDRSGEIGQIVGTISAISEQTNLLALNAAIEAARAGEQGRGFAVVADEVRKLAEESQESTKQISELINQIQTDTGKAVSAMKDGTEQVRIGIDVVGTAGVSFANISELVQRIASQIQESSHATRQISDGSQRIVKAMDSVESITGEVSEQSQAISATAEQQTAAMHEIADASNNLAKIAEEMMFEVRRFKL